MTTQELPTISKETQKAVLKAVCESPVSTVEELALLLKNTGNNIPQEEVLQVIQGIAPNKNWHRATQDDLQKELLNYVWSLESQILFLFPTKQKETTIAEFNQLRLQNKQSKVPKDLIRHLQNLLSVDGKNLSKFRKFEKDLSPLQDIDVNVQAGWVLRIILANLPLTTITSGNELPTILKTQFIEKLPLLSEKVGRTIQRICERFTEKYFGKNLSDEKLRELVNEYQSIYNLAKKSSSGEGQNQSSLPDQNRLVQNIIDELKKVQETINDSHEGGFLSKLFTGKVKNKEGIIGKIDGVINLLSQITSNSQNTNKIVSEKVLLVQKLQSDYENIIFVKTQLENDLYNLNEKIKNLEETKNNLEKELQDKTSSLEKAHEKIASIQQKVDLVPELESRTNMLREELNLAKDFSIRLHGRINKIKADLLKQNKTESEVTKPRLQSEPTKPRHYNNGNQTIHKVQQNPETGETVITTEVGS